MYNNVKHLSHILPIVAYIFGIFLVCPYFRHIFHSIADGFLVTALSDRVSTAIAGHRRPTPNVRVHHLVAVRELDARAQSLIPPHTENNLEIDNAISSQGTPTTTEHLGCILQVFSELPLGHRDGSLPNAR